MATFWKIKAFVRSWVGKAIGLVIIVLIILGVLFMREPLLALWSSIESRMGLQ